MKVMVTGSKGLVGTPLVRDLSQRHEVVEYDRVDGLNVHHHDELRACMGGCDVVVHLAAISWPKPGKQWWEFWKENCVAVHRVAQAAVDCGVKRLVFTSSTAYYGCEEGIPVLEGPHFEDGPHPTQYVAVEDLDNVRPQALHYIQSKVIAENILAAYGLTGALEVAILRLCPVRGDPYLGLYVYNENVTPAIVKLVETSRTLQYEVFNMANPNVGQISMSKWEHFWGPEWQYVS
jgi:nucleoside-diphosphate-sugar epimerase